MAGEPPTKKSATDKVKIGTHNGTFHCDEALACFMLKLLPQYSNAEICRTRDNALLDTCDVVVDVGGVYDPSKHRYDHHQRSFSGTMQELLPGKSWTIKLSSAGLVYLHFGRNVLTQVLGKKADDRLIDVLYDKVYEGIVMEVDAIDNGVSICETPKYSIRTNLSARVANLNPSWNEKNVNMDERFAKAMELVGSEFLDKVRHYSSVWWPARELVQSALNDRHKVDESGEIMTFDEGCCPWKEHLFMLEEELGLTGTLKFILFPDEQGRWRVQAVPVKPDSFILRIPLCKEWGGLRDEELSQKSGIPGCVFVHSEGFIGGHTTRDGALQMARITLSKHSKNGV